MQDNFNTFSKIEDYLNNNLSKEERIAFEKQLESNPELQTLVDDYNLVDVLIEENELTAVNNKLTVIHRSSVLKKNVIKGLIGLAIVTMMAFAYFVYPKTEVAQEKIEIQKETSKSIDFLVSEPTPFKILDSMSEVKLSNNIKNRKEISVSNAVSDTILSDSIKPDYLATKLDSVLQQKEDSTVKQPKTNFTPTVESDSKPDSIQEIKVRKECELSLTADNIQVINSCQEKSSGSIQFLKSDKDYLYSINDKGSYSSSPYFSSLREGSYQVSIKSNSEKCESKSVTIVIEGYICNYIIHPDQFIFLEKSLEKFQDESTVEIFIFNRNGGLVFNQTLATNEKFYWEGKSNTNLPTPMGNYTYIIKSGNKVSKGEITIIR